MSKATWILTKLGGATGQPVICSNQHPDYTPEKYDVQIGQACFERNWNENRLVDISEHLALSTADLVFGFRENLEGAGVQLPE